MKTHQKRIESVAKLTHASEIRTQLQAERQEYLNSGSDLSRARLNSTRVRLREVLAELDPDEVLDLLIEYEHEISIKDKFIAHYRKFHQ